MYSFIVLGIIPGTDIQINFQIWLDAMVGLVLLALIAWLVMPKRSIKTDTFMPRTPLHASQLHFRI